MRSMVKHVIGMAKRFLDLRGAKAPKLELDYLRLLYAVKEIRREGNEAQGYLVVLTSQISAVASRWGKKYGGEGAVITWVPPLSQKEKGMIEAEVKSNIEGMLIGSTGLGTEGRSSAALGASIAERYLVTFIEEREPGVYRETRESLFPFRVRWDYYGKKSKKADPLRPVGSGKESV